MTNHTCYRAKCFETSRLLAQQLKLSPGDYEVVFQSRLGRTQWIGPDILSTMTQLAQNNVKNILVVCPSFVADCLETLEEIGMRAKAHWDTVGGKEFTVVPCLNGNLQWADAVANIIQNNITSVID